MQILADTERQPGRWVLVPSKNERFLGPRARAYVRARERRLRVFTILVEALGISALIGLFPPLRLMWIVTFVLGGILGAYVLLLLKLKAEYEAHLEQAPKRAVPVFEAPEILENELRILPRAGANGNGNGHGRRAREREGFTLPTNVRVYAAR
jgi:hypothetical protein